MNETYLIFFVALTCVGLAIRLFLPRVLAWRGVWFTWHTKFGPALVFDSADADGTTVRLLNVNGTYQSVCYVDDELLWDPVCEYHRSWAQVVHRAWPLRRGAARDADKGGVAQDAANKGGATAQVGNGTEGASSPHGDKRLSHVAKPGDKGTSTQVPSSNARPSSQLRRALVMGGGGYSFPKWIVAYRPDFACEVAEIDPAITRIARERFFLTQLEEEFDTARSGRLVLVAGDAWAWLKDDADGYDLIVNDAFKGNRPLGPMGTDEGAAVVRAHLHEDGVYVGNVRTPLEGRGARPLREAEQAFSRVFAHVRIIPERPEEPRKKGNNALVAWGVPEGMDNEEGEA